MGCRARHAPHTRQRCSRFPWADALTRPWERPLAVPYVAVGAPRRPPFEGQQSRGRPRQGATRRHTRPAPLRRIRTPHPRVAASHARRGSQRPPVPARQPHLARPPWPPEPWWQRRRRWWQRRQRWCRRRRRWRQRRRHAPVHGVPRARAVPRAPPRGRLCRRRRRAGGRRGRPGGGPPRRWRYRRRPCLLPTSRRCCG